MTSHHAFNAARVTADADVNFIPHHSLQSTLHIIPDGLTFEQEREISQSYLSQVDNDVLVYSAPLFVQMEASSIPTTDKTDNSELISYSYTIKPTYQKLLHTYVTAIVPRVSVAEEYEGLVEVSYCANLSHNIVTSASLRLPAKDGNGWDNEVNTFFHDAYRENDCNDLVSYDYAIGNRRELTDWSTVLETQQPIVCPLRFVMEQDPSFSIPAHLFLESNAIQLRITYSLSLKNLVRMRVKNEKGEWEEIPFWGKFLEQEDHTKVNTPSAWAIARISDSREIIAERTDGYSITVTDYVYINPISDYQSSDIQLINDTTIVRGICYAFLNESRVMRNDHSFYTLEDGSDPQAKYRLEPRVTDRDSIHSTIVQGLYNCRRASKFIHEINFDFSKYNSKRDTGVIFNKPTALSITLRERSVLRSDPPERKRGERITTTMSPEEKVAMVLRNYYASHHERDRKNTHNPRLKFLGYTRTTIRLHFSVGSVSVERGNVSSGNIVL